MDILIIVGCIVVAIFLLLAEFTILPGITVAGIGAAGLFIYAVFLAYTSYGIWGALLTLCVILIGSPILVLKVFKGKAGRKMRLEEEIEGKAEQFNNTEIEVGMQGVAVTRMAPIGNIKIGDNEVEAKSIGMMIDQGQTVEVIQVELNQITVRPVE